MLESISTFYLAIAEPKSNFGLLWGKRNVFVRRIASDIQGIFWGNIDILWTHRIFKDNAFPCNICGWLDYFLLSLLGPISNIVPLYVNCRS